MAHRLTSWLNRLMTYWPGRTPPTPETLSVSGVMSDIDLSLFKYRDIPVQDIMTERADIRWIDLEKSPSKIVADLMKHPHRFYPVSRHDLDKVQGKFDFRFLGTAIEKGASFDFSKHLTPLLYISPTLTCHDLLLKMKDSKNHIAIVVDEFGGVDGLVTLSDITLKILAEIDVDVVKKPTKILKDKSIAVDGRMTMDDFEEQFGSILTSEDKENNPKTIGGLVLSVAGYIPARGEIITHSSGTQFEIVQSDARRIKRLRVLQHPSLMKE